MTQQTRHAVVLLVIAGLTAGLAANGAAAVTPAQKCRAGKNRLAGRYAVCRHNAEARLVLTGKEAAYTKAVEKCVTRHATAWRKLEQKLGVACPSVGDELAITSVLDGYTASIATAVGGGILVDYPGDLARCTSTLTQTQSEQRICEDDLIASEAEPRGQRLQTGQTLCTSPSGLPVDCAGTGQDGDVKAGLARSYVDNGNGTVTDPNTNLTWEKLASENTIHNNVAQYTWAEAFSVKIAALNAMSFAGHNDWRLPNRSELESLVNLGKVSPAVDDNFNANCSASCTVLSCSCTQTVFYWSSTSYRNNPSNAWGVDFLDGRVWVSLKSEFRSVRAVRGGSGD